MRARLVGLHKATKRLATGHVAVYAYSRRGGPLIAKATGRTLTDANKALEEELGRREALDAFNDSRAPVIMQIEDRAYVRGLIAAFKASPQFKDLADSTRTAYAKYLTDFDAEFGIYKVRAAERATIEILDWRDEEFGDTPRAADYLTSTISRLFGWAKNRKLASLNPMDGIERLYKGDRSDRIWTEDDIAKVLAVASPEVGWAVRLAAETGFRTGDLVRLTWSEVGAHGIVRRTRKKSRQALVPLTDAAHALLAEIPKRGPIVLTNTLGRPWTSSGFKSSYRKDKTAAGIEGLTFHDLRGTAATRIYLLGYDSTAIAGMFAWEKDNVEALLRKYVSGDAVALDLLARMKQKPPTTNRLQTGPGSKP